MLFGLSGLSYGQTHPDLIVKEIDFRTIEKSIDNARNELENVKLDLDRKLQIIDVSIPDYKIAFNNFAKESVVPLEKYHESLIYLKKSAEMMAINYSNKKVKYESRLDALKKSQEKFSENKDIFKKSYNLELQRMNSDLESEYNQIITRLQQHHENSLKSLLSVTGLDFLTQKNTKITKFEYLARKTGSWIVTVLALPANIIPATDGDGLINSDLRKSLDAQYENQIRAPREINRKEGPYSTRKYVRGMREKYDTSLSQITERLYKDCRTATCVYAISKDYLEYFQLVQENNKSIEIGNVELITPYKISMKNVKKNLRSISDRRANGLPTAIFND